MTVLFVPHDQIRSLLSLSDLSKVNGERASINNINKIQTHSHTKRSVNSFHTFLFVKKQPKLYCTGKSNRAEQLNQTSINFRSSLECISPTRLCLPRSVSQNIQPSDFRRNIHENHLDLLD